MSLHCLAIKIIKIVILVIHKMAAIHKMATIYFQNTVFLIIFVRFQGGFEGRKVGVRAVGEQQDFLARIQHVDKNLAPVVARACLAR